MADRLLLSSHTKGKTSLLNAIAGRLGALPIVKGEVEFVPSAGAPTPERDRKEAKVDAGKVIGFVRQNDFLLPFLTGERACPAPRPRAREATS